MKHLLLIRHAQTESIGKHGDFDRCLTKQGILDCFKMSQRFLNLSFSPDFILASTAMRTHQTAQLLANHLKWTCPVSERIALYQAYFRTLIDEIKSIGTDVNSLVIIAHNPGISDLKNRISNSTQHDLPPCGMALLQFNIDDWNEILTQKGTQIWIDAPNSSD